jgi:hypothetical protein
VNCTKYQYSDWACGGIAETSMGIPSQPFAMKLRTAERAPGFFVPTLSAKNSDRMGHPHPTAPTDSVFEMCD